MGYLTARRAKQVAAVKASLLTDPGTIAGLLSLAGITSVGDAEDGVKLLTRGNAMGVPALNNGVTLFLSISNLLTLKATRPSDPSPQTPRAQSFLDDIDPTVPAGWTLSRTVDDLIWTAISWWLVTSRDANGFPRTAEWLQQDRVTVVQPNGQTPGHVLVDRKKVDQKNVKRFDGITDGLLSCGDAIRTAIANCQAARVYAENPAPAYHLADLEGQEPLDDDDATKYLLALRQASRTKASAYLGGTRLESVGWSARELQLVEARQQDALEMARLLALPPKYVAAPAVSSELVYANLAEVRRDLFEIGGMSSYLAPIEQRLSMPDMTPKGTVVKFDSEPFFDRLSAAPGEAPSAPKPEPSARPAPLAAVQS